MKTIIPVLTVLAALIAFGFIATQFTGGPPWVKATPAEFALIPAGEFTMGDALDGDENAPLHKVTVSAFFMQKTDVTKAQWDEVWIWAYAHGYHDLPAGFAKVADHPVWGVSWYGAVKWCNAKSEKEGLVPCYYTDDAHTNVYRKGSADLTNAMVKWDATGYRLPTETEWEKAARGGLAGKRFPSSDTISHSEANFENSGSFDYGTGTIGYHPTYAVGQKPYTSPVGSFAANGFGLYDMTGNLWQWCWDQHYFAFPDESSPDPHGVLFGWGERVIRGGAWHNSACFCGVAYRNGCSPLGRGYQPAVRIVRSAG